MAVFSGENASRIVFRRETKRVYSWFLFCIPISTIKNKHNKRKKNSSKINTAIPSQTPATEKKKERIGYPKMIFVC